MAILIVDDEPLIRKMLTLLLEKSGFTVIAVANGEEAIHKVRCCRDDIQLMICDVEMPEQDAPSFIKHLSADQPHLPIILLSDEADSSGLSSLPAVRFLPKPFNVNRLLGEVHDLVREFNTVSAPS